MSDAPTEPHDADSVIASADLRRGGGGAGAGQPPRKSRVSRVVLIVFSVALFAAILWFGGLESWRTVLSGDPWLYLTAFVLSGIIPSLSAWRLQTLVRAATGARVAPWRRFFHINMTAVSLGLFLPRNAALLGGKAAYLRTLGVPVFRGSWAVLVENLIDALFLAALVVPCGLVIVGEAGPAVFVGSVAVAVGALLAIALWARRHDWRAVAGALVRRVPWVYDRLPLPEGGFVPGPVRAVRMLVVTTAIHLLLALRAYVIALAIGLEAPWLVIVTAYPLAQLGLALAVAPGALGTLDASWLGLLLLGGLSNAEALSFTVALRACIVVFPILWYGVSSLLALTISDTIPEGVSSDAPGAREGSGGAPTVPASGGGLG